MLQTGRLFVGPILADAISVASNSNSSKVNKKMKFDFGLKSNMIKEGNSSLEMIQL